MLRSGTLCFIPCVLSCIALILSIFANARCNLLIPNNNVSAILTNRLPFTPSSLGLWCYETTTGKNIDLRNLSVGDLFQAARALGVVTLVLGWMIFLFYTVAGCFRFSPKVFKCVGVLCIFVTIFQGSVFIATNSILCIGGCTLDTGGKCAVAATVMWFLTGIASFWVGQEAEKDDDVVDNKKAGDNNDDVVDNRKPIEP